jgi:hypothetical protein
MSEQPQTSEATALARANRLLVGVALALLVPLTGVRLLKIATNFSKPSELSYPNSVTVRIVRGMKQGEPIYRDFRESPHIHTTYGPLFYEAPALFARLTDADEVGIFEIGRSLSLAATLGSLAIMGLLLRRHGAGVAITLLVLGVYAFAAELTWPTSLGFRPDPDETLFTLAGLALLSLGYRSRWRYLAPLFFLTAFLFKQSALIGPIAGTIYLYAQGLHRPAALFALITVSLYAGTLTAINVATHGLYLLNNFGGMHCNFTWTNPFVIIGSVIGGNYPIVISAFLAVLMAAVSRDFDVLVVFVCLHAIFVTATTLRDGSAGNYFLPTLAVGCVLGGRVLSDLLAGRWPAHTRGESAVRTASTVSPNDRAEVAGRGLQIAAAACLVSIGVFCLGRIGVEFADFPTVWRDFQARTQRHEEELTYLRDIAGRLDALGGPILSQYDPINLYAQHSIMADLLVFSCFADNGVFDDQPIIDMIKRQEFAAIVLRFPASENVTSPRYQSTAWFRDQWLDALKASQYSEWLAGEVYIYTPARQFDGGVRLPPT